MTRCFDCLADLPDGAARSAVLVKMRDLHTNWQGDDIARAFATAACYDMQHVCADCAQWYGDEAVPLEDSEDVLFERQQEIRVDTYCESQRARRRPRRRGHEDAPAGRTRSGARPLRSRLFMHAKTAQ